MSLFIVVVPTREYELGVRKKNLEIEAAIHLSNNATPRASLESMNARSSNGSQQQLKYMALSGGRHVEIIVSDDYMETKDPSLESAKSNSVPISPEQIEYEKIQAEIEKYFLEKHLEDTLEIFGIISATWTPCVGSNMSQVEFTTPENITDAVIKRFRSVGIGSKYDSSVTVCTATIYDGPAKTLDDKAVDDEDEMKGSGWSEFVQSIKARLTVAQVVAQITSMTTLNFDFLMFVLVAALIACLGLVENNSVILVASMLISPLMGPIMAFTFASVIREGGLLKMGFVSEIIGLLMCLFVGFTVGCALESEAFSGPWASQDQWPTKEMTSRGHARSLIIGIMMAVPSGVGVALSVLAGNAGSLVGVAIAASLLPPAVNCGLFWGLSFTIWFKEGIRHGRWNPPSDMVIEAKGSLVNYETVYYKNIIHEFSVLGIMSFGLTMVNIIVIFIVAVLILKIKEVAPYTTRKALRRFWREDVAMARQYNHTHGGQDMKAGIIHDLHTSEHAEEVKKKLNQDQVFRQINQRVIAGGGGDIDLNNLQGGLVFSGSDIELPRSRRKQTLKEPSKHGGTGAGGGGWFGWFGSSSASKTKREDEKS